MRKRFEKAFNKVLLNENEKNQIIENVISRKSVTKEKSGFWYGKMGGVIVVAAALLVFVLVNAVILGGMRKRAPASEALEETEEETTVETDQPDKKTEELKEKILAADYVITEDLSEERQEEFFELLADYLPVKNAVMTSCFGTRGCTQHTGIDMTAEETTVYLVMDGTVTAYGYMSEKGNCLVIDHGNGVVTEYHHLQESMVSVGDVLSAGTPIAVYGNTGASTGAHLHWEIIVDGEYKNTLVYLAVHLEEFTNQPWD